MRHPTAPFLLGLVLAAAAACADSASRLAAPDNSTASLRPSSGPSLSQGNNGNNGNDDHNGNNGNDDKNKDKNKDDDDKAKEWDKRGGNDKITICHAAGRVGTTKYVEITVSKNASYAHLDEHGTPRAGHEEDYIEPDGEHGCKGTTSISKKLVEVMTTDAKGNMINDPTWTGGAVTIPKGETRWLFYRIDYALPGDGQGTLSEDPQSVCATLGSGFKCSFNTSGKYSWSVSGSGSKTLQIDLTNNSRCDTEDFINTAVLTPKGGKPVSASVTTLLKLTCRPTITFTKRLVRVFTMSGDQMIDDPTWTVGQPLSIPVGETRWVRYQLDYSLPTGVTGTITENHDAVCGTVSTGMHCGFNTGGVFSWSASGSGSVLVDIDLSNDTGCGEGSFTNTAILTPTVGGSLSASASTKINLVCPIVKKTLDRVFIMSGNQMVDDPNWTKGQAVTIPFGETRWLRYVISYTLPNGVTGTVTENHDGVCATASSGLWCGFNTGGVFSWSASGTGSVLVDIDLINQTGCGNGSFTNTAVMTLANGGVITVTAPTKLVLGCKK
jgi:hypothetical protein